MDKKAGSKAMAAIALILIAALATAQDANNQDANSPGPGEEHVSAAPEPEQNNLETATQPAQANDSTAVEAQNQEENPIPETAKENQEAQPTENQLPPNNTEEKPTGPPELTTFTMNKEKAQDLNTIIEQILEGKTPEELALTTTEDTPQITLQNTCSQGTQEITPTVTGITSLKTCYDWWVNGAYYCDNWVCPETKKIQFEEDLDMQWNMPGLAHGTQSNYSIILIVTPQNGNSNIAVYNSGPKDWGHETDYICQSVNINPMDQLGRWNINITVTDNIDQTNATANTYVDVINCPNTCTGNTLKHNGNYSYDTGTCQYQTTNCENLNTIGEWEYYCQGTQRKKHRTATQYQCTTEGCQTASTQYTDDQIAENCSTACHNGQCTTGCSGALTIKAENLWGEPIQGATVLVNGNQEGTTNQQGELQIPTYSNSCGQTYTTQVKIGTYSCGTKNTTISHYNKNSTVMFNCNTATQTLNLTIQPSATSTNLGNTITFELTTTDQTGNPIQGAEIGVYDPIKIQNTILTTNQTGQATYTTTTERTGLHRFQFTAGKRGYLADIKEIRIEVKTKYVLISVMNEKREPIENAKIMLDSIETARSSEVGEFVIESSEPKVVTVIAPNNAVCDERNISFENPRIEEFVCLGVMAYDFDGDGWTDEEELIIGSDPENPEDNFCTALQQYYDEDWTAKVSYDSFMLIFPTLNLFSTDSNEMQPQYTNLKLAAILSGTIFGAFTGATNAVWDLGVGLLNLPDAISKLGLAAITILSDEKTYIGVAEYTNERIMQPIKTRCQTWKSGYNFSKGMAGGFEKEFRTAYLPYTWNLSENFNYFKKFNLGDKEDQKIFTQSFTAGHAAGYVYGMLKINPDLLKAGVGQVKKGAAIVGSGLTRIKHVLKLETTLVEGTTNVSQLTPKFSSSAQAVYNSSQASDDVIRAGEALSFAEMEKQMGATLIKTESQIISGGASGADYSVNIAGKIKGVSVKRFFTTDLENIATRIITYADEIETGRQAGGWSKNVLHILTKESNYNTVLKAANSALTDYPGMIPNRDILEIMITKAPDWLVPITGGV